MAPFYDFYYRTALPYYSSTENLSPTQLNLMENSQAGLAIEQAAFTSTGVDFYHALVSPPDTIAPTIPTNLTGFSTATTTATVTWSGSTDNVGVAGYYVFR